MQLRFEVADAGRFLRIDAAGRIDERESVRMAREIAAFRGEGCELPLLLDLRAVDGALSVLDMVTLVKQMLAEPGRYRRRLALLTRDDQQRSRAQFMQDYSSNRGIPIAAFAGSEYEAAVRWLAGEAK